MVPSWLEIQKQPWFSSLTPEQKAQSLDQWTQDMQAEIGQDTEQLDLLGASSELEKKRIFGEEVPAFEQYLPEYKARKAADQQGFFSQMGGALKTGLSDVTTGLGVTFDKLTGDNEELAQGMAAMNETQRERQLNKTTRDVELEKALAENAKQFKEAKGFWPTTKELIDYAGIAVTNPVAMTKMALESAPNALISIGATTAGGILGAAGGPAGIAAGAAAGGAAANIPMEIPGAIHQSLMEATQGQAANWDAAKIKEFLDANPQVTEAGLNKGVVRGAAIGLVEGLTAGIAGKVATIPERAAQKAMLIHVGKQIGKDIATPTDVADFLKAGKDVAKKELAEIGAKTIEGYSMAQRAGLIAGAEAIETVGEGLGEYSAQKAAGEEVDPTAIFQEMAAGRVLGGASALGARLASLPQKIAQAGPEAQQAAGNLVQAQNLNEQAGQNPNATAAAAAAGAVINKTTTQFTNLVGDLAQSVQFQEALGEESDDEKKKTMIRQRLAELERKNGPLEEVVISKDGTPKTKRIRIENPEENNLFRQLDELEKATPAEKVTTPTEEDDVRTASETMSEIQARTAPGPELEAAVAERRKAAERIVSTLQKGDIITDVDGNEYIVDGTLSNGKVFVKGAGEPVDAASMLTPGFATDAQGNRIEEPPATITRASQVVPQTPPVSKKQTPPSVEGSQQTAAQPTQTTGSVPLMVTVDMRRQLADLGYSKAQINSMKPADAQDIIARGTTAPPKPKVEAPTPTTQTTEPSPTTTNEDQTTPQTDATRFPPSPEGVEYPQASDGTQAVVSTPSADVISELDKLPSVEAKLKWLHDNGFLTQIEGKNSVELEDRVMVLMRIGNVNVPFYISTGLAGKKNVKAGQWYAVWGIGSSGWINKGREEDINTQYGFPVLQKLAKILNEGIGRIDPSSVPSLSNYDSVNSQMNMGITPAATHTDSAVFWPNVRMALTRINEETEKLIQRVKQQQPAPTNLPPTETAPQTPTPTSNAPIQRQVSENRVEKRVQTDEGGQTAETGGGNRPPEGGQGTQEDVTLPPQGVVPTESLPEGQPTPGGVGKPPSTPKSEAAKKGRAIARKALKAAEQNMLGLPPVGDIIDRIESRVIIPAASGKEGKGEYDAIRASNDPDKKKVFVTSPTKNLPLGAYTIDVAANALGYGIDIDGFVNDVLQALENRRTIKGREKADKERDKTVAAQIEAFNADKDLGQNSVNLDDLVPGSTVDVAGTKLTVDKVQYDEDGRTTSVSFKPSDRYGRVEVFPEDNLKSNEVINPVQEEATDFAPTEELAAKPAEGEAEQAQAKLPLTPQEQRQEKLAELQDKKKALWAKLRSPGLLGNSSMLGTAALEVASELALVYAEEGVVRFADFAQKIREDLPDLWDALRNGLRAIWTRAADMNPALEDAPSREEAQRILASLDTLSQPPVAEEIVEEEEAPVIEPAPSPASPEALRTPIGFGSYENKTVEFLLANDPGYLFNTLFDANATVKADPTKLAAIREIVRQLPEYKRYVASQAKTKEQLAAERTVAVETSIENLKNIAPEASVTVAESGAVQVKKPSDATKSVLKKFGFVYNSKTSAFETKDYAAVKEMGEYLAATDERKAMRDSPIEKKRVEIRAALDEADDESRNAVPFSSTRLPAVTPLSRSVMEFFQKGVRAARVTLQTAQNQLTDALAITLAKKNGKPMYLLGSQAGYGKTYVIASALAEMLERGVINENSRVIFFTKNANLIDQAKEDIKQVYNGKIEYKTYQSLHQFQDSDFSPSDVLIFDEAHDIRYSVSGAPSRLAKLAEKMINKAAFTLFSTATPYESVEQMRFLWPTGVFNELKGTFFPEDSEEKGWKDFAVAAGATPKGDLVTFNAQGQDAIADQTFAREFLRKKGMFSYRATNLPEGMAESSLAEVEGDAEWAAIAGAVVQAFEQFPLTPNDKGYVTNFLKRILEASKMGKAAEIARNELEENPNKRVVVFTETREESVKPLAEFSALAAAMAADPKMRIPEGFPQLPNVIKAFAYMHDVLGIQEINFPSIQDFFQKEFGKDNVVFYTGNERDDVRKKNKKSWEKGEPRLMVATMAAGGTGLSLHDTSEGGKFPRVQISVNLPWRASDLEQVSKRTARSGMTSKAKSYWLFANNIFNEKKLASTVASRLSGLSFLVTGQGSSTAQSMARYEWKPLENEVEETPQSPSSKGTNAPITEPAASFFSADLPEGEPKGKVSKKDFEEGMKIVESLIRKARVVVVEDTRENLLKREDIPEEVKITIRKGAQGVYYQGRAIIVRDGIQATSYTTSYANAAAAVIFHEMLHYGMDVLRYDTKFADIYSQWRSMVRENVTPEMLDNLARNPGYRQFAGWADSAKIRVRAEEEVFVRQMESLFRRKGNLAFREQNLLQRIKSWIGRMLERLFGEPIEGRLKDEILESWGKKIINAVQISNVMAEFDGGVSTSMNAQDAEYLAAVEAGDTEKAQRMVNEAAKAAGYTTEVFHGTNAEFNIFRPSKSGNLGPGIYVATDRSEASDYASRYKGSRVIRGYARIKKAIKGGNVNEVAEQLFTKFPGKDDAETIKKAQEAGYDAVWADTPLETKWGVSGEQINIFDPNQIKSADPVTYDENGNVILLSQRFNPESPDIRLYAGEDTEGTTTQRRRKDRIATFAPEDVAAVKDFMSGNDQFNKLKQVLGLVEGGEMGKVEKLAPLKDAARNEIGFEDDSTGAPVVTPEATQKAKELAEKLLDPDSKFGAEYQSKYGVESAATAVLQMELLRYGLALAAKNDSSLLVALRSNWNGVMLGAYVSATSAGRVLNVRSHYVNQVMKTIDMMDKAQKTEATRKINELGVSEDGAETFVTSLQNVIKNLQYAQERREELVKAMLSNQKAGDFEKKGDPLFGWVDVALTQIDKDKKQLFINILTEFRKIARLTEQRDAMRKSANAAEASILDDIGGQDFEVPSTINEIDAAIENSRKKVNEYLNKWFEGDNDFEGEVIEDDDSSGEADNEVEDAEDANDATEAAKKVIENLKAFLAKKYSNKKPAETAYQKIKEIVDAAIANPDDWPFTRFKEEAVKELKSLDIDAKVQDELISRAFTVFTRYQQKDAERLASTLVKEKAPSVNSVPEKVQQLRKLVKKFLVNKDRLPYDAFIQKLTEEIDKIGGIKEETADKLAEAVYKSHTERRQEQLNRKFDRIREALLNGSNETLARELVKDKNADPTNPVWRIISLKKLLVNSGLSQTEASEALRKFTQDEIDKIFELAEGTAAQMTAERADAFVKSFIKRYERQLASPPKKRTTAQESLRSLVRAQVKVPLPQDLFVAEAARFGATQEQALRLYNLARVEADLLTAEKGVPPTMLQKLVKHILSRPALANDPVARNLAIENFLRHNGYSDAMIASSKSWIQAAFEDFIKKAKIDALDKHVAELRKRAAKDNVPSTFGVVSDPFLLTGKAKQQLDKDLSMIRKGLGDFEIDPQQALAKELGYTGFRPEDYKSLAELDLKITRAIEDGRQHDVSLGLKELYELLSRRRAPKSLVEVASISYINSALGGLGTLGVNVISPAGAFLNRVMFDLGRALVRGKIDEAINIGKIAVESLKKIARETEFGLLSGASNVAMNNVIQEVTTLQGELLAARRVVAKGSKASLMDKLKARYTIAAAYTGIISRVLMTADHVWSSVLQNYFLKVQSMNALIGAGKLTAKEFVPMVYSIQTQEQAFLDFNNQVISAFAQKADELFKTGNATKDQLLQLVSDIEIPEGLSDENRVFIEDFKGDMRRVVTAFEKPETLRRQLTFALRQATNNARLRTSDRINRGIYLTLQKQISPAQAEAVLNYVDKESDYEMGTHRGEKSPMLDVVNTFAQLVRDVGQSVKTKNPILGTMLFGFFGIPVNLFNRALWLSPYGFVRYFLKKSIKVNSDQFYQQSMQTQAQMRQRLIEAFVGTAAIGLMILMKGDDDDEEGFNVTLAGPSNKTEQDAWRKKGHRQGSFEYVTKDGKVISLNWARGPLEPFKIAALAVGALDDMRLNRKLGDKNLPSDFSDYFSAVAYGWSKQAAFFGVKNTVGAFLEVNPEANIAGNLLYKLNPFVPFAGTIKSMENMLIGPDRFRGRTGAYWLNLPIARSLATERAVNALGDPQGYVPTDTWSTLNDRAWYNGMPLMVSGAPAGSDKRIYDFILDRGTGPGIPQRSILENQNGIMPDRDWLDYVAARGRIVKSEMIRQMSRLERMDDEDLSKAFGEISSKATREAKRRFGYK